MLVMPRYLRVKRQTSGRGTVPQHVTYKYDIFRYAFNTVYHIHFQHFQLFRDCAMDLWLFPSSKLQADAEAKEKDTPDKTEYDYLLNMNLWSLT